MIISGILLTCNLNYQFRKSLFYQH